MRIVVERNHSPESPSARRLEQALRSLPLDRQELAAIFAGGFIGAILRAGLSQSLTTPAGQWPWATFIVNLLGAALLGYFITRLQERLPPSLYRRAFLGTGICGALTTFSTVMVELMKMLEDSQLLLAGTYAAASLAGGFAAVFLATKLVRRARLTG
ncbi:MAG TPA: fluoride efflux transporter CrcB [Solirubrobacteraceae bacterium]